MQRKHIHNHICSLFERFPVCHSLCRFLSPALRRSFPVHFHIFMFSAPHSRLPQLTTCKRMYAEHNASTSTLLWYMLKLISSTGHTRTCGRHSLDGTSIIARWKRHEYSKWLRLSLLPNRLVLFRSSVHYQFFRPTSRVFVCSADLLLLGGEKKKKKEQKSPSKKTENERITVL